jgi:hypothetical protein
MSGHDTALAIAASLFLIASTVRTSSERGRGMWHGVGVGMGIVFVVSFYMLALGGLASLVLAVFGHLV